MEKQGKLTALVLALSLLSLTGLAQAGHVADDEALYTSAIGTAGIEQQLSKTTPPKGNAFGRCKNGKVKTNKPCASPS